MYFIYHKYFYNADNLHIYIAHSYQPSRILQSIAGHRRIEPRLVQQGQAWDSIYPWAGWLYWNRLTSVQPVCGIFIQAITAGSDHSVLPAGKAPRWQNTIALWEGFPHLCWWGKSSNFLSVHPLCERKLHNLWAAKVLKVGHRSVFFFFNQAVGGSEKPNGIPIPICLHKANTLKNTVI